ncbi:cdc42 effector protein 1 isoform X2 [Spea bombifrons]|uniref:cdc42 effector protein 1 isoform X2 n=1 Tax=Spea bombifrons TaxID=233779 RepID=UPI00234AD016|nr:cdc42 effector protein 1 isoform X2 [Spea bombifrons]
MNLGSLPVIKSIVSRSKRERRVELTADMISPPLGDFRHTVHVGRKGEVFGDASFLNKFQVKHKHSRWGHLTKNLRHTRWVSSGQPDIGVPISQPPTVSPILKNAVSLPLLTNRSWDDRDEEDWKSLTQSPSGLNSAFCTLPRQPCSKGTPDDTSHQMTKGDSASADYFDANEHSLCSDTVEPSTSLWHPDSMESLIMDFGPSLMSEILNKISFSSDSPETGTLNNCGLNEQNKSSTNLHNSMTMSTSVDHSYLEPTQSQIQLQETKEHASWKQVNVNDEMELGIKEDEEATQITKDFWEDSDDGSEVEM